MTPCEMIQKPFNDLSKAILTLLRCRYNKTDFHKTIWIIGVMVSEFQSLYPDSICVSNLLPYNGY